ncbi:hypothetical protein ACFQ4C_04025 [Larkinella insperata]|uniref:WD40 repeat protein n=1 Tax=Larkinella insperata TaxID=332158 RepID=A0ABW3Q598_9BACT|nr:hypothetical protein [Larkinella insperata]
MNSTSVVNSGIRGLFFVFLIGLFACKSDEVGESVPGWPNLPVKNDLYFFRHQNIQKINLGTGVITAIGGSDDKPDQSRSVDVSRDGREIAFNVFDYDSNTGRNVYEIRVMDPSGRRVLAFPTLESYVNVKIAPDKSKFATKKLTDDVMVIYGRNGAVITAMSGVSHYAWTPDGRLVLTNTGGEIALTNKELTGGSTLKKLTGAVREPDVSPDGQKLAFYHAGNVWTMKLDGSDLKQLTRSSLEVFSPCWSPDGKYLSVLQGASQQQNHLGAPNIFLIPSAATAPVEVTDKSQTAIRLYEKWPESGSYTELNSRSQAMLR